MICREILLARTNVSFSCFFFAILIAISGVLMLSGKPSSSCFLIYIKCLSFFAHLFEYRISVTILKQAIYIARRIGDPKLDRMRLFDRLWGFKGIIIIDKDICM